MDKKMMSKSRNPLPQVHPVSVETCMVAAEKAFSGKMAPGPQACAQSLALCLIIDHHIRGRAWQEKPAWFGDDLF